MKDDLDTPPPSGAPGGSAPDDDALASSAPPASPRRGPWTRTAWVTISLIAGLTAVANNLAQPDVSEAEDRLATTMMRVQSQYIVGVSSLVGEERIAEQIQALDSGPLAQRQRFVVLAAEVAGPAEAAAALRALDADIDRYPERVEMDATTALAQHALRELYLDVDDDATPDERKAALVERVAALDEATRDALVERLDWFGRLALAPAGTPDAAAREQVLSEARQTTLIVLAAVGAGGLAGLAGLVLLVAVALLALRGTLGPHFDAGATPHGVYAETFAVWMTLFLAVQLVAGMALAVFGTDAFAIMPLAFLASLGALFWPVLRGVPWSRVRREIGWWGGTRPPLEPLFGGAGYLMALPLLAIGVMFTLALLAIQNALTAPPGTFESAGAPAHPIVIELLRGGWWLKLQVLLLASVVAPIVEETMFRGVLYRALRDWSGARRRWVSVLISGGISSFIFAAIHPQGWVAIPALMGLAAAFVLVREWRGTLLPSMIVHGLSNGLVMSVVLLLLGG